MKNIKHTWIFMWTVLLVFLQPALSFGHGSPVPASVTDNRQETVFFKTKNVKALVFHEVLVASDEQCASPHFTGCHFILEIVPVKKRKTAQRATHYLIDFRGMLSTQIFPFHFFL